MVRNFEIFENKIIIKIKNRVCENSDELISSDMFYEITRRAVDKLIKRDSTLLSIFDKKKIEEKDIKELITVLKFLAKINSTLVPNLVNGSEKYFKDKTVLLSFIEYLYDYWRSFERYIVCDSSGDNLDTRPYRTFNLTIETLAHLIRGTYRDVEENISSKKTRTYRQIRAGAEVATIAVPVNIPYEDSYKKLSDILVIRQILLFPPLILNPPINKRTGEFVRIEKNPLDLINLKKDEWIAYPAKVGPLIILAYVHVKFYELGFSLCNLFELAEDKDLKKAPDAVMVFGCEETFENHVTHNTVFYDDEENNMLIAAIPRDDKFGYFGYLKKMMLTLHNIRMMKNGKMPFHGAMLRILLRDNKEANILMIGDTGTGKSETLEAFRTIGAEYIRDLIIIADDMGSLEIQGNKIIGYGTEIGAFLRLDDLQPGYALGQIDRAIIMSPSQVNARIILPVTQFEDLNKGQAVNYILYMNNYEEIDEEHPIIEKFDSADVAIDVFREGTSMSKGTTTDTGIVHAYFVNVFGPTAYKQLHDEIATKYFKKFFAQDIFVGQLRTRLGIKRWERQGPEEAAKELLDLINDKK